MKKIFILIMTIAIAATANAQDFKKQVSTAKASYKAGKLEEAHFALQNTLQELDMTIGKEVIKLLPNKMDTMKANIKDDHVTGNIGFVGATIQRTYGTGARKADVTIVSNSPLIGTLNAYLTSSFLANMAGDGKTKVLKVQGYKSRLTKEDNTDNAGNDYQLEIPLSNAMITVKINNSSENEIMAIANALPLESIAKLIQ